MAATLGLHADSDFFLVSTTLICAGLHATLLTSVAGVNPAHRSLDYYRTLDTEESRVQQQFENASALGVDVQVRTTTVAELETFAQQMETIVMVLVDDNVLHVWAFCALLICV